MTKTTQTLLVGISIVALTIADKGFQQSQYSGAEGEFGGASLTFPSGSGGGARGGFGGEVGGPSSYSGGNGNEGSLEETIPGSPGEDYPIFSKVPETSFICDGQVDGGYYGDPEAECQAFHICANDGNGGLSKFSFLCPNGTLFQQQYFVCDWWFNVDCSTTEDFYSLNDEIAAEREANSPESGAAEYGAPRGSQGGQRKGNGGNKASASAPRGSYVSPSSSYSSPKGGFGSSSDYSAPSGYGGFGSSSGLGGYARNPRGLDLASVLVAPPLPQELSYPLPQEISYQENQVSDDVPEE